MARGRYSRFFTRFCDQACRQGFLGKAERNHRMPLRSAMQGVLASDNGARKAEMGSRDIIEFCSVMVLR